MAGMRTLAITSLGLNRASFLACLGAISGLAGCSERLDESTLGTSHEAATGAFAISGLVTSSKGPVGGATVKLQGSESRTAFTDSTGHYSIPGLGNGGYQVSASASTTCSSSVVNLSTLTANVTVDLGMTGTGCASVTFVPGPTGPAGAAGAVGPTGAKGATGANGANGANGAIGATGPMGPAGPQGLNGQNGYNGLNGLNGATGATGAPGANGAPGAAGPAGPAGPKGDTGAAGPQGLPGPAAGDPVPLGTVGVLTLDSIGTMPIRFFSQSVQNTVVVSGGGGGTGKAQFGPVAVTRDQDRFSPILSRKAADGTHFASADLVLAGGKLTIELEDIVIVGDSTDTIQDGVLLENIALDFRRITWKWTDTNSATREASWDIAANTGSSGGVAGDYAFYGPGVNPPSNAADWIECTGFATGISAEALHAGTGGGTGKAQFEPINLETEASAETLQHFGAVASGKHDTTAAVHFLKMTAPGDVAYERIRYDLESVTGLGVQLQTTPTGELTESLSLDYNIIKWTAKDSATAASTTGGWNIPANRPED